MVTLPEPFSVADMVPPESAYPPLAVREPDEAEISPPFIVTNPADKLLKVAFNVPAFRISSPDPKGATLAVNEMFAPLIVVPPVYVPAAFIVNFAVPFMVKLKLPPDWPIAPNVSVLIGLSVVTVIIRLPVSVIAVALRLRSPLMFKPIFPFISTLGFLTVEDVVEAESVPEFRIKVPLPVPPSPAVMRVPESRVVFPV